MNIVPKQGGNRMSGLVAASGFSKSMQSNNYTEELKAREPARRTRRTTSTTSTRRSAGRSSRTSCGTT